MNSLLSAFPYNFSVVVLVASRPRSHQILTADVTEGSGLFSNGEGYAEAGHLDEKVLQFASDPM